MSPTRTQKNPQKISGYNSEKERGLTGDYDVIDPPWPMERIEREVEISYT